MEELTNKAGSGVSGSGSVVGSGSGSGGEGECAVGNFCGSGSVTKGEGGLIVGQPTTNKKKKTRTTFTGHQIFELEKQFELKKYLSSSERAEIAIQLKVTETQVSQLKSPCEEVTTFVEL